MSDEIVRKIMEIDFATLLAIAAMFWIFKCHQDKKFDKIEGDMKSEFKRVDDDLKEIRTSLNRMEGAFYSKECCMLHEEKHQKKAE